MDPVTLAVAGIVAVIFMMLLMLWGVIMLLAMSTEFLAKSTKRIVTWIRMVRAKNKPPPEPARKGPSRNIRRAIAASNRAAVMQASQAALNRLQGTAPANRNKWVYRTRPRLP